MKKYNIRTIAFLFLIIVSLFSYSYLSCVSINTSSQDTAAKTEEKIEEASISVPDITLVKKLISLGSKVIISTPI